MGDTRESKNGNNDFTENGSVSSLRRRNRNDSGETRIGIPLINRKDDSIQEWNAGEDDSGFHG